MQTLLPPLTSNSRAGFNDYTSSWKGLSDNSNFTKFQTLICFKTFKNCKFHRDQGSQIIRFQICILVGCTSNSFTWVAGNISTLELSMKIGIYTCNINIDKPHKNIVYSFCVSVPHYDNIGFVADFESHLWSVFLILHPTNGLLILQFRISCPLPKSIHEITTFVKKMRCGSIFSDRIKIC
jgi:hypothetical protein